ncbi:MAG: hypothetical protein HY282_12965 [Nitrospirae bacterium]|nr:hypothetical protein [Candidatus Manganitrophaceae bacterium]
MRHLIRERFGRSRTRAWDLFFFLFLLLSSCAHAPLQVALPDSSVPYDRAWKVALDTSLNYYDRIAVADKEAGFFQTVWTIEKSGMILGNPVKRSRLIGNVVSKAPFRLYLTLEEEAFSLELGRWVKETNEPLLTQIGQDIASKLQF